MIANIVKPLVCLTQSLFTAARSPLTKLLLWMARGSSYWCNKWVAEEKNITNKWYMRQYLLRGELDSMEFLQKHLIINAPAKYNTKWELFRLLAVMELINNGSAFGQMLLAEATTPFLAGKLCLTPFMEKLVEIITTGMDGLGMLFASSADTETFATESCLKVHKLSKV